MKKTFLHKLLNNKSVKKLFKTKWAIALIIVGLVGVSGTAYATYSALNVTQEKEQASIKPQPKPVENPKPEVKPTITAEPAPIETPAPTTAPAPQTSAPKSTAKATPAPQPDPKAECQQKIAALRVPFDAKSIAMEAAHKQKLAELKKNFDNGHYTNSITGGGYEAYMADVSAENNAYFPQTQKALNDFYDQIKAIGCWF